VDIYSQEGDVAISLSLHGEHCVGVDAVEVEEEVIQFFTSMGSDHEGVINITEPTEWFVCSRFGCLLFKDLHAEVGRRAHGHSISMRTEMPIKTEK
jgi:hypothetical protein